MYNMKNIEYRKIQGIVGEQSFSVVLPKKYALDLGIGKGDFVKVYQHESKIVIEKASEREEY
jgi:bifunctional DNA-binding transcriptional regulator/antitoxin component of YhaV-PrlF toxin-antitoxin module